MQVVSSLTFYLNVVGYKGCMDLSHLCSCWFYLNVVGYKEKIAKYFELDESSFI